MVQKPDKFPSIWIQCQFEPDENRYKESLGCIY